MSNKKKNILGKVMGVFVCAALLGGGYFFVSQKGAEKEEVDLSMYRQETAMKGTVATGFTENGTVSFGTLEQVFEVAEVSSSDASSDSGTTAGTMAQSTTGFGAGVSTQGGMGQPEGAMSSQGSAGGFSSAASSSSSTSESSLIVDEVYAKIGQTMSVGDKIFKITEESIQAYQEQLENAVKTAQLSVQQEEINLEIKKADVEYTYQMYLTTGETAEETYNATIKKLEAEVTEIEEDIEEAQEEVDEYQGYVDAGYDYEDELEEAQEKLDTLQSNLLIARNALTTGSLEAKQTYDTAMNNYKYADQLHEIDLEGLEDDLNDAKETLADAEDALAEFLDKIGDGIVYAEYDGTVTELAYAAGDAISNGATAVTYTNPEDVTISVSVSQEDISGISTGMEAAIELDAYAGESFAGTVESISTSAAAGSSTVNYEVTVLFSGDISKVYSGMTGDVTFNGESVTDKIVIANKAVYMEGTKTYVRVLTAEETIQEREITTGFSNGSIVAVESGLEEGETILIG